MEVKEIEILAAGMSGTGIVRLELRLGNSMLQLSRAGRGPSVSNRREAVAREQPLEAVAAASGEHFVCAPAVGRFVAHHPTTREAFVDCGCVVRKGNVLGMIRCGSFLREVTADVEGRVRDVLANDRSLVGFGQKLFAVEVSE